MFHDGGAIMADSQSNFERLLGHLENDSLATRFVTARMDTTGATPAEALRRVLVARLNELINENGGTKAQQD
jgi:hypothetical protein